MKSTWEIARDGEEMKPKVETYVNHVLVDRKALVELLGGIATPAQVGWDIPSELVMKKVNQILDLVGIEPKSVEWV